MLKQALENAIRTYYLKKMIGTGFERFKTTSASGIVDENISYKVDSVTSGVVEVISSKRVEVISSGVVEANKVETSS